MKYLSEKNLLSILFRTRQAVSRAIKSKTITVIYSLLFTKPRVSRACMITDILPHHQYVHVNRQASLDFSSSLLELDIFFSYKRLFTAISLQKTGTKGKATYKTERWREDKAYGNLGNAYHSLGDFKTAIDYHERQLKIATELGDKAGEGNAYGNLGNAHDSLGDFKTAINYHERYLKIARELGDKSEEGKAYGSLGNAHHSLGDFKTAIDYHEHHLKITKELGDKSLEGKAYDNLGNAHHSLGNFKSAIDCHERQLKITKELGDKSEEGKAYNNLGKDHHSLRDFKKAIDYHELHLKIAREEGHKSEEGKAYHNLGIAHGILGDFKTAIDYHERQLKIATELGDKSLVGEAYGNLGPAHRSLGDFKTAIDYHERYLKIARKLGDKSLEGEAYGNLGNTHDSLGDFKSAIDYHERDLKIARELGDKSEEGKAYGNLGNAYHCLGDFKTALHYHKRHLKISQELGNRIQEGAAYGNLGNAHHSVGNFEKAIDYHERHLKMARELGDKSGKGRAYANLGNAYHRLGDFKTALHYYKRKLKIAQKLGSRIQEGCAYGNLGNAYHTLEDLKTAIDCHERHLKISRELGARSEEGAACGSLGNDYHSLGDFKTAIDYYESFLKIARELDERSREGKAYGCLGTAHRSQGDFKTAIDYHERHLKIAKELNDKFDEGLACINLGSDFRCLDQVPMAIEYYQLGITLLNDIRDRPQLNDELKISLRDQYRRVYTALWRLMLADDKVTEALLSAEQGRAQGLRDLMALNYSFDVNDFQSVKENGTFRGLFSSFALNTIFMAIGGNEIIFWVCQKGKEVELRRKKNSSQDEINIFLQSLVETIGVRDNVECEDRSLELARDARLAVKRPPQDDRQTQCLHLQERALRTLYDTIIDPIQDLLSGSELVFIPEGPLCLAPFAAFKSPDSKDLCESFRIRVAPSLTCLKMIWDCPENYHRKSGVLLVGDPWVQDVTNLGPLHCAREEVNMIGKMVGSTPLVGIQATKDEVLRRLGSVALVHIAAHGEMKTGEIALAPKRGEKDFILTMKDVKSAKIRARLVVLSCCHSARGQIKAEGVVGIARAFLGAGARSVLVSLWAIDDKATLEFMKKFYQHLVEGKSASEALNRAMNCMRQSREFTHWAPFVLIGDDVTLEFDGSK